MLRSVTSQCKGNVLKNYVTMAVCQKSGSVTMEYGNGSARHLNVLRLQRPMKKTSLFSHG